MCEGYLHDGIERVETSLAYNTTYTAQSEKTFQDDVGGKSPHSTQHHSSLTVQNMLKHILIYVQSHFKEHKTVSVKAFMISKVIPIFE
jgi:hypothetical protein